MLLGKSFPFSGSQFLVYKMQVLARGSISHTGLTSTLEMLADAGFLRPSLDSATFWFEATPASQHTGFEKSAAKELFSVV